MEIPSSIGSTPVKVNWHECKVPADETWTVPIGDVVSGQHYHYGDVGFMISGWIKKVHITSYEGVERRIEGQTLYLTTSHRVGSESEPHIDCMPDLMESKFRIYPWMNIKNIVVTRRHIDPIARKLM